MVARSLRVSKRVWQVDLTNSKKKKASSFFLLPTGSPMQERNIYMARAKTIPPKYHTPQNSDIYVYRYVDYLLCSSAKQCVEEQESGHRAPGETKF